MHEVTAFPIAARFHDQRQGYNYDLAPLSFLLKRITKNDACVPFLFDMPSYHNPRKHRSAMEGLQTSGGPHTAPASLLADPECTWYIQPTRRTIAVEAKFNV